MEEAFVLSKFCCTAGFVIQSTEKYTFEEYNGALAGNQSIDSRWRWLKKYVPHSVKARAPKGCPNPVNPLLDEYVYSWQWRTNCKAAGKSLWLQLGEEVFKA